VVKVTSSIKKKMMKPKKNHECNTNLNIQLFERKGKERKGNEMNQNESNQIDFESNQRDIYIYICPNVGFLDDL